MKGIKEKILGILICIVIAGVSTLLAGLNIGSFSFEVIGAPVFAIVIGMVIKGFDFSRCRLFYMRRLGNCRYRTCYRC